MVMEAVTTIFRSFSSPLSQLFKDFWELEANIQLLNNEVDRMERRLRNIERESKDQRKKLPPTVEYCVERTENALKEADNLITHADRQRDRCLGCCLLFSPKIPTQIRKWKTRCNDLSQRLDSALSEAVNTAKALRFAQPQAEGIPQPLPDFEGPAIGAAQQQLLTAQPQAEGIAQPLPDCEGPAIGAAQQQLLTAQPQAEGIPQPDSGFVGSTIEAAQLQLLAWLNESHPQARVIGVYGMGGVGKTSLLELIYKKVSTNFNFVILHTISQNYKIESLQDTIAKSLNLTFKSTSSITRKMELYESLENKRFLLVLDDIWSPIDLNEVGVNFGGDKGSKVLISSRYRDVVEIMAEKEFCMMIRPLSQDEGWELFQRRAFRNGAAPDNNLEAIARQVASECKGLPLAINTVAAVMARKKTADEWSRSLVLMKNVDPSFPSIYRTIDAELYQRLRLSYNDLPNHDLKMKMCFLYCAAFPEDARIRVETLVEMWAAERLVPQTGTTYFMDAGRECIEALVDRCLIEYVDEKKLYIKVHDVLRDMAIYEGQREENWLFEAGQRLRHFPREQQTRDRKRISVLCNEISDLPTDFKCPTLVSLKLAENTELKKIPEGFLENSMSLKVLDLSSTSIETLPTAVGQLEQLEFLNLSWCRQLKCLPDSICNLSDLQFLNLEHCGSLEFLPDRIGKLKNLKHLTLFAPLSVSGSDNVVRLIPHQISLLTSLNKLVLPPNSTPVNLEDLTNLSNLIELDVTVKPEIKAGSMSTWSKMRKLRLWFQWGEDENRDDAALEIRPQNMQIMKELQSLKLEEYRGVSLPNCIYQFQNLKNLQLSKCMNLKELPALEIGSEAARDCFPNLEELVLDSLNSLEIDIVWNAKTMPQLQSLRISGCRVLKTLRMEELPNLRELYISDCAELKELFMESGGGFPELRSLYLSSLDSLDISIVCNAKTMPQLQTLQISGCRVLKTLRMEELPNLRKLHISDCSELKELFMESGGGFPELETLNLSSLCSLEIIVWNAATMPQLQTLQISGCVVLKTLRMEDLPNLMVLNISFCHKLKELFMESGGGFPKLQTIDLECLYGLEISIPCNAKTMPQLQRLSIGGCDVLKTLRVEELPNLRELYISDCDKLKELFMESGGGFPELRSLYLSSLNSLEISIVCNAKTMPQLYKIDISDCRALKALRIEEVPNLQCIQISRCSQLEIEIGSLPKLKELSLRGLKKAESIARPSSVWNEETMPNLEFLKITGCPLLRRMPKELEKLPKLKDIAGELNWWDGINWENDDVKSKLSPHFKESKVEEFEEDSEIEEQGSEVEEYEEDSEIEEQPLKKRNRRT